MTMKITLQCDANGCLNEVEIEDTYDSDISREGWRTHPCDGEQHYCPKCWPIVEKELEDE